jgi:hypothetical protein
MHQLTINVRDLENERRWADWSLGRRMLFPLPTIRKIRSQECRKPGVVPSPPPGPLAGVRGTVLASVSAGPGAVEGDSRDDLGGGGSGGAGRPGNPAPDKVHDVRNARMRGSHADARSARADTSANALPPGAVGSRPPAPFRGIPERFSRGRTSRRCRRRRGPSCAVARS